MPATCTNVNVGITATLIIAANPSRQELFITNNGVTPDAYIGPDATVTSSNGLPLYSGQTRERDRGFGTWLGAVYGITASGTADIRVWETTK